VRNPLNEELDVMRTSLLPGLLKNALNNYRYGNEIGRLFELGYVFGKSSEGYKQSSRLSLIAWGQKQSLWNQDSKRGVVYDLKAAIEAVLEKLNVTNYQWQPIKASPGLFHPAQTVVLFCEGRPAGIVGSLHPLILENEKVRTGVALAEIDFDKLMRGQPRLPKAQSLAKFPSVQRDLALVMPDAMAAGDVIREIKKSAGALLKGVEAFDVFTGGNLPAGHKSVAFRMTLQDSSATLTDAQIQGLQAQVLKTVSEKLKLQMR